MQFELRIKDLIKQGDLKKEYIEKLQSFDFCKQCKALQEVIGKNPQDNIQISLNSSCQTECLEEFI